MDYHHDERHIPRDHTEELLMRSHIRTKLAPWGQTEAKLLDTPVEDGVFRVVFLPYPPAPFNFWTALDRPAVDGIAWIVPYAEHLAVWWATEAQPGVEAQSNTSQYPPVIEWDKVPSEVRS